LGQYFLAATQELEQRTQTRISITENAEGQMWSLL